MGHWLHDRGPWYCLCIFTILTSSPQHPSARRPASRRAHQQKTEVRMESALIPKEQNNKGGPQLLACCVAAAGLIQTYKSTMPTPKNTKKHPFQVVETGHKMSVLSNINYILTCRSVLDCSLATDRRAGPQTISPVAHDRPAVPPANNATHTAHASAVQRSAACPQLSFLSLVQYRT